MLTAAEQRKVAKEFAKKWDGRGYEKGESQSFWLTLLRDVYGVNDPSEFIRFEDQVKIDNTSFIDGYIPSTHVLIEQKSIEKSLRKGIRQSDGSLLTPYQQAKRYSAELPYSDRPRWIVISNFKEFNIYDMEKPDHEPEVLLLKNLEDEYYRMNFLIDEGDINVKKALEVSLQAGELVGVLYDALLKEYDNPDDSDTLHYLNVLCVRIIFCLYAEDAGLFGKHSMFHDYLAQYKDAGFRNALMRLFKVLNQKPEERDPYLEDDLAAFPYVNGGLFDDDRIVIPRMNDEIIDVILNKASANFDWSKISPTIFGAVFESTLNPETRREGGMHYTSVENIHKVIDPLFMNELNDEFEYIISLKTERIKNKRLREFQDKLASLKFLDPACGSGNFLTETYISLRRLENKLVSALHSGQIILGDTRNFSPIKVSISQFYGIEINDFAVTVAKTALWIAESQMMKETEDIINAYLEYFPIDSDARIVEGNALRVDWEEVAPKDELNYIMGNPPFVGAEYQTKSQKDDMRAIFGRKAKLKNLDYVACWFIKTMQIMCNNTLVRAALVSTNSVTQGEQVETLWVPLLNNGITIDFAYQTFKWNSEAKGKAAVHCVIIGFSKKNINIAHKYLYSSGGTMVNAKNINPYLVDAPNVIIKEARKSLCGMPKMMKGNQPTEGGFLLLSVQEKNELLSKDPTAEKWIKRFMGAREFIQGKERYCLWFADADMREVRKHPLLMERIERVREMRLASSDAGTRKKADIPWLFRETNNPERSLVVPATSSEKRRYVPIGYVDQGVILSNAVLTIPNGDLILFAVLISNVHMAWMRVVAGRLKSDYRYSAFIVYNTFPFPNLEKSMKLELEKTAENILKARKIYKDWTMADLYDDLIMPPELRTAHQENDKAVMEAYGFDWREMTESECVAELMKMYQELVQA